jgi:hypothetical protein
MHGDSLGEPPQSDASGKLKTNTALKLDEERDPRQPARSSGRMLNDDAFTANWRADGEKGRRGERGVSQPVREARPLPVRRVEIADLKMPQWSIHRRPGSG